MFLLQGAVVLTTRRCPKEVSGHVDHAWVSHLTTPRTIFKLSSSLSLSLETFALFLPSQLRIVNKQPLRHPYFANLVTSGTK